MSYYRKTTMFAVVGAVLIVVGFATLFLGTASGLVLANGVLFLILAGVYRSRPMLKIEEDHLEFELALLRSTRFVAREDVESIDLFGDDVQINLLEADPVKVPAKQLQHVDSIELEAELNEWVSRAA